MPNRPMKPGLSACAELHARRDIELCRCPRLDDARAAVEYAGRAL
jgi:hypothetical protein